MPLILPALALIFLATYLVSGRVLAYALRRNIIDIPNDRSSHSTPTPRGGGIAFVATIIVVCPILWLCGWISSDLVSAVVVGGGVIAILGWLDDCKGLSVRFRFFIQILAVLWAVFRLGKGVPLDLGVALLDWGVLGILFFTLACLWLVNLYNFMDGIDGLAAGVAVVAGLAGGVILYGNEGGALALAVGAATLGFLPGNWPPARIFMGDVGSGFLGLVFACLWMSAADVSGGFFVWPILLAPFIVDATLTLLRRMRQGEKWYASHRSHVYQLAASRWGHACATKAVIAITILWLTPCAAASMAFPVWSPAITIVAYAPLFGLYWKIRTDSANPQADSRNPPSTSGNPQSASANPQIK